MSCVEGNRRSESGWLMFVWKDGNQTQHSGHRPEAYDRSQQAYFRYPHRAASLQWGELSWRLLVTTVDIGCNFFWQQPCGSDNNVSHFCTRCTHASDMSLRQGSQTRGPRGRFVNFLIINSYFNWSIHRCLKVLGYWVNKLLLNDCGDG